MEQEVIDMTNAIARDGLVFFPDFCSVVLMKFRFLTTFCESPKLSLYFKDKRTRSSSLSFHSRWFSSFYQNFYNYKLLYLRWCVVRSPFQSISEPRNTKYTKSFSVNKNFNLSCEIFLSMSGKSSQFAPSKGESQIIFKWGRHWCNVQDSGFKQGWSH